MEYPDYTGPVEVKVGDVYSDRKDVYYRVIEVGEPEGRFRLAYLMPVRKGDLRTYTSGGGAQFKKLYYGKIGRGWTLIKAVE